MMMMVLVYVFTCTGMKILDFGKLQAALINWLAFVNIPGKANISFYRFNVLENIQSNAISCASQLFSM